MIVVLQTSITGRTLQDIYVIYKKRWIIETYYHYIKNKADYGSLYQQDYYKTQGLAFIMLASSLIHKEFEDAVKAEKVKVLRTAFLTPAWSRLTRGAVCGRYVTAARNRSTCSSH